jgi:hypothetical protein
LGEVAVGSLVHLVFVDCDVHGRSPVNGVLTEFGAVYYETGEMFHGSVSDSSDPATWPKPSPATSRPREVRQRGRPAQREAAAVERGHRRTGESP